MEAIGQRAFVRAQPLIAVRNVRASSSCFGSCSGSIRFRNTPIARYTTECSAVVNSFFNSMLGTRKITPTSSTPMPRRLAMASCFGSRLATLMRLSSGPVHRTLKSSWNRTSTRIPSTEKCGYVTRMVTWLSLQVRTARLVRDSLFLALSPSPRKHNSVGTKSELPVARRVGCSKREQLE